MNIFILIGIIVLAFALRYYGINWDLGAHLHPDERMLILVADKIHFFDQLNPDFFNYGTLPIYILKGSSQLLDKLFNTHLANYDGMLIVGRSLSIMFDLGTVVLTYTISRLLFKNEKVALLGALIYSIAFFPIQNSHFFVVDVYLTFFISLTLYALLNYVSRPHILKIIFIAVALAAALATKVTAVLFLPFIVCVLFTIAFFVHDKTISVFKKFFSSVGLTVLFFNSLFSFHFLFMPYAYIAFPQFSNDILQQSQMNSNPYVFPYTLQYVYTTPYLYYLKNIFLWGLGPVISLLSIVGISSSLVHFYIDITQKNIGDVKKSFQTFLQIFSKHKHGFTVLLFYLFYFVVIGHSSVKFMRYMLPLYPICAILAGVGLHSIQKFLHSRSFIKDSTEFHRYLNAPKIFKKYSTFSLVVSSLILLGAFIYTLSFVHIYSQIHTRTAATQWILANIPHGSTLAVEHWDDRVPIFSGELYQYQEMTLYDVPDDDIKWQILKDKLQKSDYIILASNRLYVPLTKLEDCSKYSKCYPKTSEYYRKLFSNKLNFRKIVEFSVEPKVPFLPILFSDQSADESFTVYDHPKIIIFKKK